MDKKYEEIISFDNLYKAFGLARKGSFWKDSIIDYDLNRLKYTYKLHKQLKTKKYKLKGYYKFKVQEREKVRDIKSLHITDRVFQRSFSDNCLIDTIHKTFVYDNGASQSYKGTNFGRDRLKAQMQKFYRKHGINGYVLQIDIRKYFDSIPHDYLKKRVDHYFSSSQEISSELYKIIDSFEGEKGLGLGSQVNQNFALDALNELDHYIKEVLGIKYYERYMDDIIIIHEDKGYLKLCKDMIECRLREMKLEMHPNKTNIYPLKNGIKFLGFHFYLTDTGGIYCKLNPKSVTREKRKIRKMIRNEVPDTKIVASFISWKGHALYGDSYYVVKKVQKYMYKLIKERNERWNKEKS